MKSLGQDLRFALRMLRNSPGFTAVAVMSLALGIGACTTIFSVFNAILLRPLPFKDSNQLMMIREINPKSGQWRPPKLSTFREWKKQNRSFEQVGMAEAGAASVTLSGAGEAEQVRQEVVSWDLFSVLGVHPILGRDFLPEDVTGDESTNIIISHGLWERRFGADSNVLGESFTILGKTRTVIGVMPPGFWIYPWARNVDVWVAYSLTTQLIGPDSTWLTAVGRLKPGVTVEQAQAELDTVARRVDLVEAGKDAGWKVTIEPLHEWALGNYRDSLYILLGAVGFVLLIACVNVANLLLARSAMRQKEVAVRASLGAGRLRLVRQLLTESTTLAVLGGALGVLASLWGVELFVVLTPEWFARTDEIGIDGTVLGFTLAVSVLTGMLFGLAPALRISKPNLNESLKEGGQRSGGGPRQRGQSVLVVTEMALALVLLVGAGLMINSFVRLQRVDHGFHPDNLFTGEILLDGTKYWDWVRGGSDMKRVTGQGAIFYERLLERVRSVPGVESADIISVLPTRGMWPVQFGILGRSVSTPSELPRAGFNEISAGFFRTMKIPLLRGRSFTERDVEASPWVVVINQSMARQFFPDEDPIGKVLQTSMRNWSSGRTVQEQPRQIVGVVGDVRHRLASDPSPAMYVPYRQHLWETPSNRYEMHLGKSLVVRTATNPMSLASAVRRIVSEIDKDQVVYRLMTMDERLSESVGEWRFYMRLYSIFAGLAVILAAVGIYGVTSYSVGRRTREFGIRMALGAQRGDVLRMVLREGFLLAGIGLTIGVATAFGLTRLIANRLYGIEATDPLTFATVSLTLLSVALLACYVPARRAAKVEPMDALRYE